MDSQEGVAIWLVKSSNLELTSFASTQTPSIYLSPHGELRKRSWAAVDPIIKEEKMEMYADPDTRGGIFDPAGIAGEL